MTPEEIKYFLKYVGRQYWIEIRTIFKSITNLARPKFWMFIFVVILLYQIGFVRRMFEVLFTLILILFIWGWDAWESGHWRGAMRREKYAKLRKKK